MAEHLAGQAMRLGVSVVVGGGMPGCLCWRVFAQRGSITGGIMSSWGTEVNSLTKPTGYRWRK